MAAGTLRLYDPDGVTLVIAGIPMYGFADGEFFRIEYENDAFTDVVGTDGEVSRSKTNDFRATGTLRLMQTSPCNALLNALHSLDRNQPGGAGVGAFLLHDSSAGVAGARFVAEKCWVAKAPDSSWDRTSTVREWKIRFARLDSL